MSPDVPTTNFSSSWTLEEGTRLLDDLTDRARTGDFFMARIYYATIATATT